MGERGRRRTAWLAGKRCQPVVVDHLFHIALTAATALGCTQCNHSLNLWDAQQHSTMQAAPRIALRSLGLSTGWLTPPDAPRSSPLSALQLALSVLVIVLARFTLHSEELGCLLAPAEEWADACTYGESDASGCGVSSHTSQHLPTNLLLECTS